MITLIVSTNRRNSEALRFSKKFKALFEEEGQECQLIELEHLPGNIYHPDMYTKEGVHAEIQRIADVQILPVQKFFFVLPEYNGGMPGALKLFIDACSAYHLKKSFFGKKAGMAGVSTGRAGNLRGMEHLTGVLNYLGITVMPNRLPISSIHKLVDDNGEITDPDTLNVMKKLVKSFIAF